MAIGQDGLAGRSYETAIPDAEEPHNHGNILFKGRVAKVFVHDSGALEKVPELVHADAKCNGEADG